MPKTREKHAENFEFSEEDAQKCFEEYTKGQNWEAIKKRYLTNNSFGNEEIQKEKGTKVLKTLIAHRDLIDFKFYRDAVQKLFPTDHYKLKFQVNGNIERKDLDGPPAFSAFWYEFIVTPNKKMIIKREKTFSKQCQIKINSPGTRSLLSDIDTSIEVQIKVEKEEDLESFLANTHEKIKNSGLDYQGRITNAIIDIFYTSNEEEFKITSGEHRDSNVYVDLVSAEGEPEYPKFVNDEDRNPRIGEGFLFDGEANKEFIERLAKCKLRKHHLELAASLFSLRVALGGDQWTVFEGQVQQSITDCAKAFVEDGTQEADSRASSYIQASNADVSIIFDEVKELFKIYERELAAGKKRLLEKQYVSRLEEAEAKARDIEVATLNRLYVLRLEEMTACNDEILELKKEKEELLGEIGPLLTERNVKFKRLKILENLEDKDLFKDDIVKQERKCALLQQGYDRKIGKIKRIVFKLCDLDLKKLELRYKAHVFANEAYVCRSAVYHVVKGMQQKDGIKISEQTILGSALQQIGFKLLHEKELKMRGKEESEIIYRTAKYSQRIYKLLFENSVEDKQITSVLDGFGPNRLNLFNKLKSELGRNYFFRFFTKKELLFLNLEMKIVSKIKENRNIRDEKKYIETKKLLVEEERSDANSKETFLSLACKLISCIYLSKFERRIVTSTPPSSPSMPPGSSTPPSSPPMPPGSSTSSGSLWGGFVSSQQPLQLTYMFNKQKKRQQEMLSEKIVASQSDSSLSEAIVASQSSNSSSKTASIGASSRSMEQRTNKSKKTSVSMNKRQQELTSCSEQQLKSLSRLVLRIQKLESSLGMSSSPDERQRLKNSLRVAQKKLDKIKTEPKMLVMMGSKTPSIAPRKVGRGLQPAKPLKVTPMLDVYKGQVKIEKLEKAGQKRLRKNDTLSKAAAKRCKLKA